MSVTFKIPVFVFLITWAALTHAHATGLFIDYSLRPDPHDLAAFATSIINPHAQTSLKPAHRAGSQVLAYISVVEIAPDAPYLSDARNARIPLPGKNPVWNSHLADISSPEWHKFVMDHLATPAAKKGFDGFFLDTAESISLLTKLNPSRKQAYEDGLVKLTAALRKKFPGKQIVINRGFPVLSRILPYIDGLLAESLYQSFDFSSRQYVPVSQSDTQWLLGQLAPAQKAGKTLYIADFVDPSDEPLARATADRIAAHGFIPFITTPEFSGQTLAPLRRVPNRVMCLFGSASGLNEQNAPWWPANTEVAKYLQMPLEWLGYEVDYHRGRLAPPQLDSRYAAICVDGNTSFSPSQEQLYVTWLIEQKNRGLKLLFFRNIPFNTPTARTRLLRALGITEAREPSTTLSRVTKQLSCDSGIIGYETPLRPIPYPYVPIKAPADATVLLSLQIENTQTKKRSLTQPLFTAPWGGVALDPYALFDRPDYLALWMFDPFAWLRQSLHWRNFPVPDPTTRDGLRIFTSHIDADGFSSESAAIVGKYSAEVIRDEVYKKYPVPITSSVITSEIKGRLEYQKPGDSEKMIAIARSIFALPNIHPASHTYSHPYFWMKNDSDTDIYDDQNINLAPEWKKQDIDFAEEVRGSIAYINEKLVPPGKKCEIMLWSGNCRPGPEALAVADSLGVENMNGGDTCTTKTRPSQTLVASRVIPWDDELQIRTPVQNEMLYTDGFKGPFFGGFVNAIDTFERTESPRRLKPVCIYYHMFSADRMQSLKAVQELYDWALKQPLHAIPSAEYARSVRDCRSTRIFHAGGNHWVLSNSGHLRTFRLEKEKGLSPDLAQSRNLLGFNTPSRWHYLTANRSGVTHIHLCEQKTRTPHLRLVSCSGPNEFTAFSATSATFSVKDHRPVTATFAGLPPDSRLRASVNGKRTTTKTDGQGRAVLELPAEADVTVEVPE